MSQSNTKAAPRVQCPRSPSGRHELGTYLLVGARDDRRFPAGTELYLQCRFCHAGGKAFLEDNQVHWDTES